MTDFAPPPSVEPTRPEPQPTRADFRAPQAGPPRRRAGKRAVWIAGIGAAVIGAGVVTAVVADARARSLEPAALGTTGGLNSIQVVSGMCLESLDGGAGRVSAVECETPHRAEAVTSFTFTEGDYPGEGALASKMLSYCAGQLGPGAPLARAAEDRSWVAWVPSEGTWRSGDRTGLCLVTSDDAWTGRAVDERPPAEIQGA